MNDTPRTTDELINKLYPKKLKVFLSDEPPAEYGIPYPIGRKGYDGVDWGIRTENGRQKLDKNDDLLQPVIPLFCPKCKRVLSRPEDERAIMLRGHCYICEIDRCAEEDFEKFKNNNQEK